MRLAILITLLAVEVAAFSAVEGLRFADTGGPALYFAEHVRRPLFDHGPMLLLALAMAVTVIAGGIDVSVAAIAAVVGCAMALSPAGGWLWYAALPGGLMLGAAMGAINGWASGRSHARALLVTLIALAAYRGLAYALAAVDRPSPFGMTGGYDWFGLMPGLVVTVVGSYIAVGIALRQRRWASRLAELRGERHGPPAHGPTADAVRLAACAVAGSIAALAGVLHTSLGLEVEPAALAGDVLWALAAVVLAGLPGRSPRARIAAVFVAALAVAVFIDLFGAIRLRWGEAAGWDLSLLRWPVAATIVAAVYWTDRLRR